MKVEVNQKNQNPFYGMRNSLMVFQKGGKGESVKSLLPSAWAEANSVEKRAMLFSLLFSIGDITGRQHNIFIGKTDSGGYSQRTIFRDEIIPFLEEKVKKLRKPDRLNFIDLIVEYTTFDNVVAARVVTKKKSKNIINVIDMVNVFGVEDIASYVVNIIKKGNPFQKMIVAKFITRPRMSKRSGTTEMLPETSRIMKVRNRLIKRISDKMNFGYENKGAYINFYGWYEWRKTYNAELESVLFSSKKINDFDKEQFMTFLETIPADARFRVRNRVMFGEKWIKFGEWYKEWEKYKEEKQKEQRVLEEKVVQGTATKEDVSKLRKVKKEAKVTTGANSFDKIFLDIMAERIDEIKLQPFLDKVKIEYNNLVFVDDSGSMGSHWSGEPYTPAQFGAFIATIMLSKNPDIDARNIIGLFSGNTRIYNGVTSQLYRENSLMRGRNVNQLKSSLINPKDTFLENYKRMGRWLNSMATNGSTNISSIPDGINRWVNGDPDKLEEIVKYPVWTLISDGEFNNMYSPESSMNDFMKKCETYFGFKPFLILIDVGKKSSVKADRFSGIDNIMLVPANPTSIGMMLTNFKDIDVYDVYTPLLSIYRSNRYSPIRNFVDKNFAD